MDPCYCFIASQDERHRQTQRLAVSSRQAIEAFVNEESKAEDMEKSGGSRGNKSPQRGAAAPLLGDDGFEAIGDAEGRAALEDAEQRLRTAELSSDLAREREDQIDQIYQDTAEVNEIFRDLAELVEEQDEQVQQIEFNAVTSRDRMKAGVDDLDKAAEYQGAFSTRIICFIIILVVIIAAVGGYLGYRFTRGGKHSH